MIPSRPSFPPGLRTGEHALSVEEECPALPCASVGRHACKSIVTLTPLASKDGSSGKCDSHLSSSLHSASPFVSLLDRRAKEGCPRYAPVAIAPPLPSLSSPANPSLPLPLIVPVSKLAVLELNLFLPFSGRTSFPLSLLIPLSLLAELEETLRLLLVSRLLFDVGGFEGFEGFGGFSLDWEKSFHLRQPSKSMRACMQPHSLTLRSSQTKLTGWKAKSGLVVGLI